MINEILVVDVKKVSHCVPGCPVTRDGLHNYLGQSLFIKTTDGLYVSVGPTCIPLSDPTPCRNLVFHYALAQWRRNDILFTQCKKQQDQELFH